MKVLFLPVIVFFLWIQVCFSQNALSPNIFSEDVVVIKLRTPISTQDARFDPYYDVGKNACFGATRCHRTNIMHPKKVSQHLLGKRAAFIQGGIDPKTGVSQQRLIFLTPIINENSIEIVGTDSSHQVALLKWDGDQLRALKFEFAPIIVSNDGQGISELVDLSLATGRNSPVAGFGSLFRTRIKPLSSNIGAKLIALWEEALLRKESIFAESYAQTMNPPPKTIDPNRNQSLTLYLNRANKKCTESLDF